MGIELGYNGDDSLSKSDIYKRGHKAYFKLIRTLNPLPKPSMSLHLFDHLVKPILLYGCEIWTPIDLKEGGDTGSGRWEIGGKKMWEVGDWG